MTQGELHDELKEKGAALLLQTIDDLSAGTVTAEPQEETKATYASLITRDMEHLDWTLSADTLHNQIRAFNPWPGTYTILPDGKRLKVWKSHVLPGSAEQAQPGQILEADRAFTLPAARASLLSLNVSLKANGQWRPSHL